MAGIKGMKRGMINRSIFCYQCKKEKENAMRKYCKQCAAEYMRAWRKLNPISPAQSLKLKVAREIKILIQKGALIPLPCEICNDQNVKPHHDDYAKPLNIRWFCYEHLAEIKKRL